MYSCKIRSRPTPNTAMSLLKTVKTVLLRPVFLIRRIIRLNPRDGSAMVLVDSINPNGIQLSQDESELIIADVVRAQLLR